MKVKVIRRFFPFKVDDILFVKNKYIYPVDNETPFFEQISPKYYIPVDNVQLISNPLEDWM